MHRFRTVGLVVIVAAIVTGVTVAATPAAADADQGPLEDAFGEDASASDYADAATAAASGFAARASYAIGQYAPGFVADLVGSGETAEAAAKADAVAGYYNANNETIEAWVNDRTTVSSNYTVAVSWTLNDETTSYVLETNATDGNLTSSELVASSNRTTDEYVRLCGYAADQSPSELETFVNEFAEPNEDVTPGYLGRMRGAYGDDVETSLVASDGDCQEATS